MKQYFEAHVTMEGNPVDLARAVAATNWKFSAIDGDINLGDGIKCYATRQFNLKIGEEEAVRLLLETATLLERVGAKVLRRKIEIVVFDDRSAAVRAACDGACVECVGQ